MLGRRMADRTLGQPDTTLLRQTKAHADVGVAEVICAAAATRVGHSAIRVSVVLPTGFTPREARDPTLAHRQRRPSIAPTRGGESALVLHGNAFEQRNLDTGQHADRGAADNTDFGVKSGKLRKQRLACCLKAPCEGREIFDDGHAKNQMGVAPTEDVLVHARWALARHDQPAPGD